MQRAKGPLSAIWENIKVSLWFIPSILIVFAIVLSFLLLEVDRRYSEEISQSVPWLFNGTPSAARSLLATIASSVITVISIAFSLTIVAIQQASVYYTPRILRTFTSDRGNQIVLGVYVATFVYALLILRAIRDSDDSVDSFVPAIAATTAIALALVCMGLLIYFINHIAQSLQATTIIGRVHRELIEQLQQLYPNSIGRPVAKPEESIKRPNDGGVRSCPIKATKAGFVQYINEDQVANIKIGSAQWLCVYPKVGDFVVKNEVIARIDDTNGTKKEVVESLQNAFVIAEQRSNEQDPLFAIRQLVDIALKALSPGVNDQTTANYCIRYLSDALCYLAQRDIPSGVRTFDNSKACIFLNKPTWHEFALGSYRQIIQQAGPNEQVMTVILRSISRITEQLPSQLRVTPLYELLHDIRQVIDTQTYTSSDKNRILEFITKEENKLGRLAK